MGSIKWFSAQFRGSCGTCGKRFEAGDQVGYTKDDVNGEDILVALECCAGTGIEDIKDLIPRGKTAKDACTLCFIIHSTNQVECWV